MQRYSNGQPELGRPCTRTPSNRVRARELRPRLLRAGLVDDQAADVEPRPSRRELQLEDRGDGRCRPAGSSPARFFPERQERAELEQRPGAALQRGLRPVRRRPDRAEGGWSKYYEPLTGGFADTYAPGAAERKPELVRLRHQRGRARPCSRRVAARPTTTTSRRTTKSARAGTPNFGIRADRDFDPGHPAAVEHRDHGLGVASADRRGSR